MDMALSLLEPHLPSRASIYQRLIAPGNQALLGRGPTNPVAVIWATTSTVIGMPDTLLKRPAIAREIATSLASSDFLRWRKQLEYAESQTHDGHENKCTLTHFLVLPSHLRRTPHTHTCSAD